MLFNSVLNTYSFMIKVRTLLPVDYHCFISNLHDSLQSHKDSLLSLLNQFIYPAIQSAHHQLIYRQYLLGSLL